MNKALWGAASFYLCLCIGAQGASYEESRTKASRLFSHIESDGKRLDYFFALSKIRNGEQVPDTFFQMNRDLSDFYFYAETKKFFEVDTNGVGRLKKGDPIVIPMWVEAAYRKNWKALGQILLYAPVIVTEAYNDDSFCKIVFATGPPKEIVEQVIEATRSIQHDTHPFLEREKNPTLLPFSSLHLETAMDAVALCVETSLEAAREASCEHMFYDNAARLCARHITDGTIHPFALTLPIAEKWEHAKGILMHLINEEKYHGLTHYFTFLKTHSFSSDDTAYLISSGLNQFAKKGDRDLSCETNMFLSLALGSFPNQESSVLYDLVTFFKDEYHRDEKIKSETISACTVLELIEKKQHEFQKKPITGVDALRLA